jgi:uncharacterized DUF497 family protein
MYAENSGMAIRDIVFKNMWKTRQKVSQEGIFTLMPILFEWDPEKAQNNFKKHRITFDEASTAFEDSLSFTIHDPLHSSKEERFVLVGLSRQKRLLIVIHTDRGEKIRIISARIATRKERQHYEENEK